MFSEEEYGGYFAQTHYIVTTKPQEWKVERQLDDFVWLSQRITNEFPDLGVRLYNIRIII